MYYVHALDFLDVEAMIRVDNQAAAITKQLFGQKVLRSNLPPYWLGYSAREAAEWLVASRLAIEAIQPDAVMILHENNFWTAGLAYTAPDMGVPCFAFQEGLLRTGDQERMDKQSMAADYTDTLFTWSDSAKQAYVEAGISEEKLVVSGMAHLDRWIAPPDETLHNFILNEYAQGLGLYKQRPVAFTPPQLNRYSGNIQNDIRMLAQWFSIVGGTLVVKVHPLDDHSVADALRKQFRYAEDYVKITWDNRGVEPLLSICSALITQHSSSGLEALAMGVPLIEIDTTGTGIVQSWNERGLAAAVITGREDVAAIAEVVAGKKHADKGKLTAWVAHNAGVLDGRATQRVVDRIEAALQ